MNKEIQILAVIEKLDERLAIEIRKSSKMNFKEATLALMTVQTALRETILDTQQKILDNLDTELGKLKEAEKKEEKILDSK